MGRAGWKAREANLAAAAHAQNRSAERGRRLGPTGACKEAVGAVTDLLYGRPRHRRARCELKGLRSNTAQQPFQHSSPH